MTMTDNMYRAAATWGRTGEIPPHDDRMAYASPGPPPWADKTWAPVKKKGRIKGWVFIVLGGLMVVMCGGLTIAALAGGDGEPKAGFTTMPAADQKAVTHAIGTVFRSGDFEYVVHGVKTGIAKVGAEQKAQGAFTRLDVTVKNVSSKARYFDTDLRVKVEDAQGRQFSADSSANIFGNKGENGWLTELNPGNSIRAFAYFDLPKDTKATRAVVSSGLFDFEVDAVVPLS